MTKWKIALVGQVAGLALWILGGSVVLAEDSGSSDSGSAMQQLQEADQDGKEAVQALERGDEEKAKEESSETFDTPHDSDGD